MAVVPLNISTIIPVFGRVASLAKAVQSALASTVEGDEVIVVDDGSPEPIVLPSDARLRIVRLERNQGAAHARNVGIGEAANPLIAFLDSDDAWLPGKLAAQRARFGGKADSLLALACGWSDARDGVPFRTRIPRPSASRVDFFAGNWFAPGSTLLIPREAFAMLGPFRETLPRLEDYEWFLRFALAGGRLDVTPMVGATIAAGRHARFAPVARASDEIEDLYRRDPRLSPAERRAMAGWLHLNRALGARNDGLWPRFILALARSFLIWPRSRLQLRPWWTITAPPPSE